MSQTKTETEMFCWQCEQTALGKGCSTFGVCGKSPEVAKMQDLLIYGLRGLSQVVLEARKVGLKDPATDVFISEALFATLTNVNFDPDSIAHYLNWTVEAREALDPCRYLLRDAVVAGSIQAKFPRRPGRL